MKLLPAGGDDAVGRRARLLLGLGGGEACNEVGGGDGAAAARGRIVERKLVVEGDRALGGEVVGVEVLLGGGDIDLGRPERLIAALALVERSTERVSVVPVDV